MFYRNRLIKELEGRGAVFNYGNTLEDRMDFIIDNYQEMMRVYRSVKKLEVVAEEKRKDAHRMLQNLRSNESRWKRKNKFPADFDKDEHQRRKDMYASIREAEVEFTYNGNPFGSDMITYYILKHMRMFKILDKFDLKIRKKVGFVASKGLEKFLWPMLKLTDFSLKHSDTKKAETFLKKQSTWLKNRPVWINNKITNP